MPVLRLLSVFVKVPERVKVVETRETYQCAQCGMHSTLKEKRWSALTFFGISFYTWKRRFEYRCSVCKTSYKVVPANFVQSAMWYFL